MPGHSWLLIKPLWSSSILLNKALEMANKRPSQPLAPNVNPKTLQALNP